MRIPPRELDLTGYPSVSATLGSGVTAPVHTTLDRGTSMTATRCLGVGRIEDGWLGC